MDPSLFRPLEQILQDYSEAPFHPKRLYKEDSTEAAPLPIAPSPGGEFSHVLLIDGAYLQIGIRDLNKSFDTNFRLEKESKLKKFFETL
jgi:hypothetical protein